MRGAEDREGDDCVGACGGCILMEIMAGGSFTPGATIELSCDGPLIEPYTAYMQGGLTYEYGKIAIINAIKNLENANE